MKKMFAAMALVLSCSLALAGCGSKPAENNAEGETKKLIMATEAGFAPYEYYDGDKVVGVDVDIANEIGKALGCEVEVADMEFGAILAAVDGGKADFGAAGLSITPERQEQVDFTIEYATSKQILVVRADSEVTKLEDLKGKIIGVQLGTVADGELSSSGDYTVQQYNKYLEAASNLKTGKIDAIGMDILPAQELVAANPELKIVEQEFLVDSYALAVKKGNTELLNKLNEVLQKLIDDGKIAEFTINHTAK